MVLPIDPDALGGDDIGEKRVTLDLPHDEAVERVREAFLDAGFGVATEFSASELLNDRVDAGRDPYHVIGACNPSVADRALDATDGRVGALFPCNVVVWEEAPGRQVVYHVSIMRIARLVGLAPENEEMANIVAKTGEHVDAAFGALED